jgi:hypothetical protein
MHLHINYALYTIVTSARLLRCSQSNYRSSKEFITRSDCLLIRVVNHNKLLLMKLLKISGDLRLIERCMSAAQATSASTAAKSSSLTAAASARWLSWPH